MESVLIVHVPHSSLYIPPRYRGLFLLPPERLEAECRRMADLGTDRLLDPRWQQVVFPVSRLLCDPERFRSDRQEPMAARGMGAVYTRCSDGAPLKRVTAAQRQALLRRWYDPHHARLTRLVQGKLDRLGRCVILDLHSFSPSPLPYEEDQSPLRPDVCIGTDSYHTPAALRDLCVGFWRQRGYTVAVDRPFAGALVPMAFYRRDPRVLAVMVELNKRLYLPPELW